MMKRGRLGGILAGLGFMLPGLLLILVLAWAYQRLDLDQPLIAAIFLGVQIGVIALIVRAVHRIGDHVLTDKWLWAVGIASAIASFIGVSFWIVLPVAGLAYAALASRQFGLAAVVVLIGLGTAIWFTGPIEVPGDRHFLSVCRTRFDRRSRPIRLRPQGWTANLRRRLHRDPVRPARRGWARMGKREPIPRQPCAKRNHPRAAHHLRHLRRLFGGWALGGIGHHCRHFPPGIFLCPAVLRPA